VIGEICESGTSRIFTFEEVDAMRIWNAYMRMHLEKSLLAVPRTNRGILRSYIAGKKVR
jgi:hypothetical protein